MASIVKCLARQPVAPVNPPAPKTIDVASQTEPEQERESPDSSENSNTEVMSDNDSRWDGQFVFDENWKKEFFSRDLRKNVGDFAPLAISTKYQLRGSNIFSELGPQPLKDVDQSFKIFMDHHIQNGTEIATIKKRLQDLKAYYRHLTLDEKTRLVQDPKFEEKLSAFWDCICEKLEDEKFNKNQEASESHKQSALPRDEISKRVLSYANARLENLRNCSNTELEASGFTLIMSEENNGAPLRRELLGLSSDLNDANRYNLETGEITLSIYKTSGNYGSYSFKVVQKATETILKELIRRQERPGKIFTSVKGDKTHIIKTYFKMVTGKELFPTLLRHIHVTSQQSSGGLMFMREQGELASQMGHNRATQQQYYVKRGLFDVYNQECAEAATAAAAPVVEVVESEGSDIGTEPEGEPQGSASKKRGWVADEYAELEQLATRFNCDKQKMLKEAIDKKMLISRRNINTIGSKMQRVAADRRARNQDLGIYAKVNIKDSIQKEKRIKLN
ncbi:hypothetical protein HDU87_003041 [Geranomyces variabilis]|uniref:Uncharacterized protein n=1 Tax=Geranomyces variabilis TaxID=109894 RepID=A0AAD5TBX7_9FUNG|nr:hypothetical protein HDU87_003041 [Geranomyces variabilis]